MIEKLIAALKRYGQHDYNCPAIQVQWHKGLCDCGWKETQKELGIDAETQTESTEAVSNPGRDVLAGERVPQGRKQT